jgi:O-6-methylguanine DNA methyltransferase
MNLTSARLETPCGDWFALMDEEKLVSLGFDNAWEKKQLAKRFPGAKPDAAPKRHAVLAKLRAYLGGDLEAIREIETATAGTVFQEMVWKALRRIPAGKPISYAALAGKVGMPTAFRAVANANGQNQVAIVIPCHRVIASDGTLGGYGGGLPMKRWLLEHEGWTVNGSARLL